MATAINLIFKSKLFRRLERIDGKRRKLMPKSKQKIKDDFNKTLLEEFQIFPKGQRSALERQPVFDLHVGASASIRIVEDDEQASGSQNITPSLLITDTSQPVRTYKIITRNSMRTTSIV